MTSNASIPQIIHDGISPVYGEPKLGTSTPLHLLMGATAVMIAVTWFFVKAKTGSRDAVEAFMAALPTVGLSKGWFSWSRAMLKSITSSREMVVEGYGPYSMHEKPFVLPSLGSGTIVVLPPSQLALLSKPESQVGAWNFQIDVLQPRYTMGNQRFYETAINAGISVVWKRLPRDVRPFADAMHQELSAGFQKYWGTSDQWTTVDVFDACSRIVSRTANRTILGLPLCHDETFLQNSLNYATAVFGSAAFISPFPPVVRKFLGPLLGWPARRYLKACHRSLAPLVAQRLMEYQSGDALPDDFLTWLIKEYQTTYPESMDVLHISQSLLVLDMMSIFSTTYGITNCVLDLYSSEDWADSVAGLREESERVLNPHTSSGLGNAARQLYRIDSCIRESLRMSNFNIVALLRSIAAPQGIQLDATTTIPQGTRIGFPQQSIHFDEEIYPNARLFDAFRFSRPFESQTVRVRPLVGHTTDPVPTINRRQELSDHISQKFLPWGYGKHACPGRLFAVQIMKLAIAYVVANYDVEPLDERTPSIPIMNLMMPPTSAKIRVRWRGSRDGVAGEIGGEKRETNP